MLIGQYDVHEFTLFGFMLDTRFRTVLIPVLNCVHVAVPRNIMHEQ